MRRACLFLAAALALGQVASVHAQPSPAPAKPKKALVLVDAGELNPLLILPPPPAEGSPEALAELAEVHREIDGASAERKAQARWDDEHESPELLRPTLGPGFDLKALPETSALLALVQTDADAVASAAKKDFPRKRPWAADATIATCDPGDKPLNAYPSGHATLGYSLALTMAQLMPQRARDLLARADDYAYSRQVCGSHDRADGKASEALATALVYTLLAKPQFQARLAAARTELAAKGLTAR